MSVDISLDVIPILVLPKFIYRFNDILLKIPREFFKELGTLILKFVCNRKETRITKILLKSSKEEVKEEKEEEEKKGGRRGGGGWEIRYENLP